MELEKIDRIIQLIITIAGEEDDKYDRELGAIHIVKYLYLADLEYAKNNNGNIFTGIPWRFYHFGHWCEIAFERIEPALAKIDAEKRVINSRMRDDFTRWSLPENQDLYYSLARNIPHEIVSSLKYYIHKFTNDTESLLHFIYNTEPMLKARPNEQLSFDSTKGIDDVKVIAQSDILPNKLSKQNQKKRKQLLADLKQKMQDHISKRSRSYSKAFDPPIYDDIFFQGLETFEKIIGDQLEPSEGIVNFSDDIWKSEARYDPDLS